MLSIKSSCLFYDAFMNEIQLKDFYNNGYGWICKLCERELKRENASGTYISRFMNEGETESKQPKFSNLALAAWADKIKQKLLCPRCGITESIDKS